MRPSVLTDQKIKQILGAFCEPRLVLGRHLLWLEEIALENMRQIRQKRGNIFLVWMLQM